MGFSKLARSVRKPYQKVTTMTRAIPMRPGGFLQKDSRGAGRAELFARDTVSTTYPCDTGGGIILLNGVAVGDDIHNRTGRRVSMKSVHVQGFLRTLDSTTGTCVNRLMIVYDRQPNGLAPIMTDIITAGDGVSFNNLGNRDRFVVIADKKYVLGRVDDTATQAVAQSPGGAIVNIHRKLNHVTTFIGTGDTVAAIGTGSLYMVITGSGAANAAGAFVVAARVRYTDN